MKSALTTLAAGISMILAQANAYADAAWLGGTISDMTTVPEGLLIRLNTGVPTNCAGVNTYNWMLIKESNKTMVAFTMAKWFSGQRSVDVYVVVQNGSCVVTQVDTNG